MKKIILVLLTAAILFVKCGKENEMTSNATNSIISQTKTSNSKIKDEETNNQTSSFLPCEYYPPTDWRSCNYNGGTTDEPNTPTISTGATLFNGMLSFPTAADFLSTMEQLDYADENYTGYNSYMNLYGGNLEKIDSFLDVRGIDESSTFINFENRFTGFYSMRKDVETRENIFLNNGGDPFSDLNPENQNVHSDDVFRTVLNKDGAVRIENIIFKFFDNGVCYAITNSNMNLFNKLNNAEAYGLATYPEYFSYHYFTLDTSNVRLLTPYLLCTSVTESLGSDDESEFPCTGNYFGGRLMGSNCKLWYRKKNNPVYYNNNKNMSYSKIAVYNAFIYDAGISKIRYYKKKSNGKWKTARTNLSAYVKENDCSYYDKSKGTKFRKFRRAAKRDMSTFAPGIGSLFQGIEWMFKNLLGNSNNFDNGYYRYFITASNYGKFYGDNYCNGNRQLILSQW